MFIEYRNLVEYADDIGMTDGLLTPTEPASEDWGFILNDAISKTIGTHSAFYFPFREQPYLIQTGITINRPILLQGAGIQERRGTVLEFKNKETDPGLPIGVKITAKDVVVQGIYFRAQTSSFSGRVAIGISIEEKKVRIENCGFNFFNQKGVHITPNADFWYLKNINLIGHGEYGFTHSAIHAEGSKGFASAVNSAFMEGSGITDDSLYGKYLIKFNGLENA